MSEIYFIVSALIGFVVIFDGYVLYFKTNGRVNSTATITSTVELIWAIVSIVALFKVRFMGYEILAPSLYVAHNIFGWIYGSFKFKSYIQSDGSIVIPAWYALFGMSVGVVFTGLCLISLIL